MVKNNHKNIKRQKTNILAVVIVIFRVTKQARTTMTGVLFMRC